MIISRTPYRVSLFGGGSDFPSWYREHEGATLSTSIDKYCYLTCRVLPPYFPHRFRVVYSRVETVTSVDEIEHRSVRNALRHLGIECGLEIHHDGDVPACSGLGTSSSFTVGLLHALHRLQGRTPGRMQLAHEAIHIEQRLNRESVGSQDQVAAAVGGLNRIAFHPDDTISVTRIAASQERVELLESHLMLVFTGVSRQGSEIAAARMRETAEHVDELREIVCLVDRAVAVLCGSGSILELGRMLDYAWRLKRGLSERISTPLVDDLYGRARRAGALGGKLLGAGGGGFLLLFVEPDRQDFVRRQLEGFVEIGFRFEDQGSHIIFEQPGAQELPAGLRSGARRAAAGAAPSVIGARS